nr:hypothetical protein [Tanacetum cinerariifolium]
MKWEASEDDDGVLDKLSLGLRFKEMKVKHLNKGVELEAWKKESSGSGGSIRHIQLMDTTYLRFRWIWRIYFYGYGVSQSAVSGRKKREGKDEKLLKASKDDDGVLDKLSLELRFKAMKVKHLHKGVELEAWKKESIWNVCK